MMLGLHFRLFQLLVSDIQGMGADQQFNGTLNESGLFQWDLLKPDFGYGTGFYAFYVPSRACS
jgi:hypothetical protein